MEIALDEAKKAEKTGEVPIGAVVVKNGEVIARAHNLRESDASATAHAELLAVTEACKVLRSWRLTDCDLYVTLEPCPMCMGAIINARIKRLYFGAYDSKAGACGSVLALNDYPLNHKVKVEGGILEPECSALLSNFFEKLRKK